MGITRDIQHKRRETGGKRVALRSKRKFLRGRQPANTSLAARKLSLLRARGGHIKYRALSLDHGSFAWGSETCTRKTRILGVVYNATSNELVRTNTLVKSAIVSIDASPYKAWYETYYRVNLGKKAAEEAKEVKQSASLKHKLRERAAARKLDSALEDQFKAGKLFARITSRPGQSGRADGYILEGDELQFYLKKMNEKKKKGTKA